MRNRKRLVAAVMAVGLVSAGCSTTDDATPAESTQPAVATAAAATDAPDPTTAATTADTVAADTTVAEAVDTTVPELVSVDQAGVTDETISVGVTIVDWDALRELGVDQVGWGDQELIWQTLIDDINANGGVHGRKVEAVFAKYNPVLQATAEAACVALTEDVESFAVLGGFTGPAAPANACMAQNGVAQFTTSPDPALAATIPWVSGETAETRRLSLLGNLLVTNGTLEGKKFGIAGYEGAKENVETNLLPLLAEAGLTPTATFYSASDGSGGQAEIDAEVAVWYEKISAEGIDFMIYADDGAGFIGDVASLGYNGEAAVDWGELSLSGDAKLPGVEGGLAGTITILPFASAWDTPGVQECAAKVEAAQPDLAPIPDPKTLPTDGDVPQWGTSVLNACRYLGVFMATMNAAELPTNESVLDAIENNMGSFSFSEYEFASFGPGKYDANDGFAVATWDPTAGVEGLYVVQGDVQDLSK